MIPGGPVRTLFLDAGGVLVDPDWARVAAVLGRHGITVSRGALAAAERPAKRDMDRPDIVRASDDRGRATLYYRAVLRRAGVEAEPARVEGGLDAIVADHARSNLWCVVPEGVPEALARLRAAGLRLAVVSNADGELLSLFERIGLGGMFDRVVDSGVVGIEKPDPRIFEEALLACGADPATTLHAGDFYEIDVVGARAAGIRAVLVDPAGLHGDRDCPRVESLAALAVALLAR